MATVGRNADGRHMYGPTRSSMIAVIGKHYPCAIDMPTGRVG